MSPKKYLSLDEAAHQLGIRNDELMRLRDRGEVRGFADRGTWKFKVEDIEELARSRQADSDPEVPMFVDDDFEVEEKLEMPSWGSSDAEIVLDDESAMVLDDEDGSDDPTVIRKSLDPLGSSDSDVRLVFDEPTVIRSHEPAPTKSTDSDSDVRLIGDIVPENDSDSDVKLVGDLDSDSDVKLVGDDTIQDFTLSVGEPPQMGSDSDIRLVSPETDNDFSLLGDPPKMESDSEVHLNVPDHEDELAVSLDSDSDVQLVGSDDEEVDDIFATLVEPPKMDSDSAVLVESADSEDEMAVSMDSLRELSSDSDVRLVSSEVEEDVFASLSEPPKMPGSDSELRIMAPGSDSDIKLVGDSSDSDSDVKLVAPELDSDSDLKLAPPEPGTLSDVRLLSPAPDSDSDVKRVNTLESSDSDVQLLGPADSSIALDFEPDESDSASVLSDESGLALGGDSAMMLAGDSGIALSDDSDEGLTLDLEPEDSGISLSSGDSGISLSLGDSGISLEAVGDSGISLEDSNEFEGTVPMMSVPRGDDVPETKFEIPSMKDDSAFELRMKGDRDTGESTQVLNLDDSGEAMIDDAVFDIDDDNADLDMQDDDDLEVSDDAFADDDEDLEDMEVFGADDDAFADDDGGSARPARGGVPVAFEQEWSGGFVAALGLSTVVLSLCMFLMFDLVKTMWVSQPGTPVASALLDSLGGMFK